MSIKNTEQEIARQGSFNAGEPVIRPFVGDKMIAHGITSIAYLATNERPVSYFS